MGSVSFGNVRGKLGHHFFTFFECFRVGVLLFEL